MARKTKNQRMEAETEAAEYVANFPRKESRPGENVEALVAAVAQLVAWSALNRSTIVENAVDFLREASDAYEWRIKYDAKQRKRKARK